MVGEQEPKIVEVHDDQISSGESSEDEDLNSGKAEGVRPRHNKGEKKNRKLVQKLGLKPISDFEKVVVRGARGLSFQIVNPEVYCVPGTKSYIVFGDAKLEDRNTASQAAALANATSQLEQKLAAMKTQDDDSSKNNPAASSSKDDVADEEDVDETGVDSANIDLVINQTGCSRAKAVKALKSNNNDVVEAILSLSP
ncbi:nascent polypeptide associated complex alpha chain with an NAC domain [Cryptosporidium sp. chipmunk genotype I]|uniref:nascent polypeptide associated complex alpha chain with an NAC domain n=1 Tax=Cryptosporidium sp. chipmunk genotype I TaxID=1280935 RepID=UPI00351A2978|nr:nascent polypeptide associated complex alpha chain with an NAC domain [Cryptosporidium sp. chipmunk genotype I]